MAFITTKYIQDDCHSTNIQDVTLSMSVLSCTTRKRTTVTKRADYYPLRVYHPTLLVLFVVGSIDRTDTELHQPQIRRQRDSLLLHLHRLQFKVGDGVDDFADLRVIVEFREEALGLHVLAHLQRVSQIKSFERGW